MPGGSNSNGMKKTSTGMAPARDSVASCSDLRPMKLLGGRREGHQKRESDTELVNPAARPAGRVLADPELWHAEDDPGGASPGVGWCVLAGFPHCNTH